MKEYELTSITKVHYYDCLTGLNLTRGELGYMVDRDPWNCQGILLAMDEQDAT